MFFYVDCLTLDEFIAVFAAEGIKQLEDSLRKHADFEVFLATWS